MKSRILTVINSATSAVVDGINSARGAWHELALNDGEKESRYIFTRYGEHPVELMVNGRVQKVMQVIDRQAAEEIASNFRSLSGQLATFFKGVPVYEGHADDPDWLAANPGHKASAVGRIKEITAGESGIEVRTVFNSRGVDLLTGEAPQYSGHSPRWRMKEIPGRPGFYRPFLLWSDALTNAPNIQGSVMALNQSPSKPAGAGLEPEKPNDDMKLTAEALKALGFAPDATPTPDEISAAIVKMLSEKTAAEAEKATAETNLTAANSKVTRLEGEITALRDTTVVTAINTAVAEGRITEADRGEWTDILTANLKSGSAALAKLKGSDALNTRNQIPDLGARRGEVEVTAPSQQAMIDATHAYAKEKGIDVSNSAGWSRAWKECAALKPELFKRD